MNENRRVSAFEIPSDSTAEGEQKCTPVILGGVGGHNDSGIFVNNGVPADEQFRSWVQWGRTLSKTPDLPKSKRVLCDLLVDAASLSGKQRRPARPA